MLWKGFQRPNCLEFVRETLTDRYGQFYAQPFERGFGTTIGNALRRILLSSIEGAAVTAVKIEGVQHEFSPLKGVMEDATDVILNLKQIPFKLYGSQAKTLHVKVDKEGEVTARDIEADADVEIINPAVHIATISDGGVLAMEMRLRKARGYVPADRNLDKDLAVGYIPVDSFHSPVTKVNYFVEDARLGQTTDYDKLTMEVWTNGTCLPQDALSMAARILSEQLSIFINFEEKDVAADAEKSEQNEWLLENLNRSIEELDLSVRAQNCLRNEDIKTIGDLIVKSEAEMLTAKNFGRKSLNEIKEVLVSMNLSLGMNPEDLKKKK